MQLVGRLKINIFRFSGGSMPSFIVFFMIHHKTREIVQFAVTRTPTREFVRQQLMEFDQKLDHVLYMIHDQKQKKYYNQIFP